MVTIVVVAVLSFGVYIVNQKGDKPSGGQQDIPAKTGPLTDVDDIDNDEITNEQNSQDTTINNEEQSANNEASAYDQVGDNYEGNF